MSTATAAPPNTPTTRRRIDAAGLYYLVGDVLRPLATVVLAVEGSLPPTEAGERPSAFLHRVEDAARACAGAHRALVELEPDRGLALEVEREMYRLESLVAATGAVAVLLADRVENAGQRSAVATSDKLLEPTEYHAALLIHGREIRDWYDPDGGDAWETLQIAHAPIEEITPGTVSEAITEIGRLLDKANDPATDDDEMAALARRASRLALNLAERGDRAGVADLAGVDDHAYRAGELARAVAVLYDAGHRSAAKHVCWTAAALYGSDWLPDFEIKVTSGWPRDTEERAERLAPDAACNV